MRTRKHEIRFRLNDAELFTLNAKVSKTGFSREAYLRQLVGGKTPVQLPPQDYYTVLRELRAIGNNMHQIAYRANAIGLLDVPAYRRNAQYVIAAADKLLAATLPRSEA